VYELKAVEGLTDGVFQGLAGAETNDATLGNLDGGARLRITGGACLALGGLERTEVGSR